MSPMTQQQYAAYTLAHQTTENKTQQVVMLYDGMMRYVNQAKQAILEKKIEERYKALEKASQIVTGLQASLDFEQGGEIAVVLDTYYNTVFTKIHSINRLNEVEMCDELIADLKAMRDAWQSVHETTSTQTAKVEGENSQSQASSSNSSLQVSV